MNSESSVSAIFLPLFEALQFMWRGISVSNNFNIVTAASNWEELQKNEWPSHINVIPRPLKGKRVLMSGSKHWRTSRLVLALWPEDRMNESILPYLLCVTKGHVNLYLGDYILQCAPGDCIYIPPGIPKGHYLSNIQNKNQQGSCEVLYLYPGRLFGEGLEVWISYSEGNNTLIQGHRSAALINNQFIALLFEQLSEECKILSRHPLKELMLKNLILLLLKEANAGKFIKPTVERDYPQEVAGTADSLEFAFHYIDSHLSEQLTVDKMARRVGLSPTNFKTLFKKRYGVTFHHHLTDKRKEFAENLLRHTDMKIAYVAKYAGLSHNQLIVLFRKHFGCLPSEYRKNRNNV